MITGPHGRDESLAEANWSVPKPVDLGGPISFHDVLDALNPLQFLPVVGTIYRVVTGDDGSPVLRSAASLIGGMLMGGPAGLVTSIAGLLAEHFFHFEHLAHSIITGADTKSNAGVPAAATPGTTAPATPAAQAVAAYARVADMPPPIMQAGKAR